MAADPEEDAATTPTAPEPSTPHRQTQRPRAATETSVRTVRTEGTDATDDTDEEDEEPRLKYSRLTGNLAGCYRSDSTSSFLVAGDKMVRLTVGNVWARLSGNADVCVCDCVDCGIAQREHCEW
jgi:hypothetical protein